MSAKRKLHLGAFMRPVSLHTGAWRYPGAYPDANFNFSHLKHFAQTLERAKFDAFFMADHLAVLNMPIDSLKRSHTVTSFDPLTLLPALAAVTEKIGLVATASTTFDQPYHVARKFASLDHISGGRAGWNLVTTSNPDAAANFGLDDHMEHGERYKRAREFFDVVTGLWDSWADDAFVRDVENGIYFDPDKLHVLDHKGQYLSVRGPLNIARPIQGWPVIVQAGASEAGRQIAAETAEAVFTAQPTLPTRQGLLCRCQRPDGEGRTQPGSSENPARRPGHRRRERAGGAGHPRQTRQPRSLRQRTCLAVDRARTRCVEIRSRRAAPGHPRDQCQQDRRQNVIDLARSTGMTVRQLAQRLGGYSGLAFVGTPQTIADEMQQWLEAARQRRLHRELPVPARRARRRSASSWCRNCSAAASSGPNMRAAPCASIWACRDRTTSSSALPARAESPTESPR